MLIIHCLWISSLWNFHTIIQIPLLDDTTPSGFVLFPWNQTSFHLLGKYVTPYPAERRKNLSSLLHSYYLLIAQCPFFFNFILIFCSCKVFALPHSIRHSQCSCGTFTLTMLFIYCRLRYLLFFILLLFPLWVQLSTYTNYLSIHSSTRLSLIASPYQMLALCPSKYAKGVVWSLLLPHAELCQ